MVEGADHAGLKLGADGFMQDSASKVVADMHFHDGSTGVAMHNRLATLAHGRRGRRFTAFERSHAGRPRLVLHARAGHTGRPARPAFEGGNFPGDETTDWSRSAGLASLTTDMLNARSAARTASRPNIGGYFDVGPTRPRRTSCSCAGPNGTALSPFFGLHGSVQAGTHTPWCYGPATLKLFKRYAALHRRRAAADRAGCGARGAPGIPPTRPLWLVAPNDAEAAQQDQEWMLGDDVLVAPVVVEGATTRRLPAAGCWRREGPGPKLTVASPTRCRRRSSSCRGSSAAALEVFGQDEVGASAAAKRSISASMFSR